MKKVQKWGDLLQRGNVEQGRSGNLIIMKDISPSLEQKTGGEQKRAKKDEN